MGLPHLFHGFFHRDFSTFFHGFFQPKKRHDPRDDTRSHFGTPPDSPKRSAHTCSAWRRRNPNHPLIDGKNTWKNPSTFCLGFNMLKNHPFGGAGFRNHPQCQYSIWDKLWVIHPRFLKLWTQLFVAFMGKIWRKAGYSCPTEFSMMGEKKSNIYKSS